MEEGDGVSVNRLPSYSNSGPIKINGFLQPRAQHFLAAIFKTEYPPRSAVSSAFSSQPSLQMHCTKTLLLLWFCRHRLSLCFSSHSSPLHCDYHDTCHTYLHTSYKVLFPQSLELNLDLFLVDLHPVCIDLNNFLYSRGSQIRIEKK